MDAAVILRPGRSLSEEQLKEYLADRLRAFEVPKHLFFVTNFPRTPKGSADRRQLAAELAGED
jgi:acyl-CoA synthetase (AMP-forming)/AMP-acid ligase II